MNDRTLRRRFPGEITEVGRYEHRYRCKAETCWQRITVALTAADARDLGKAHKDRHVEEVLRAGAG